MTSSSATPVGAGQPLIAIDVVPITFTSSHQLLIGTCVRQFEPYAGQPALPGVLLGPDETLQEGAFRALRTKAGLEPAEVSTLTQVGAFDGPGRDPRSRAISVAFLAVAAPTAVSDVRWAAYSELADPLPFDHDAIVAASLRLAALRLWVDLTFTAALTGPVFSTTHASKLEEALTGRKPRPNNFHRTLAGHPRLRQVDATFPAGTSGRPPRVWEWIPEG